MVTTRPKSATDAFDSECSPLEHGGFDLEHHILCLCFPDGEQAPDAEVRLREAERLAEEWSQWCNVSGAWLHYFGRVRLSDAVRCALRAEEAAFFGKHADDIAVEAFEPNDTSDSFLLTSRLADTWVDIAKVDSSYRDRAVRMLEIAERCCYSGSDACCCARAWQWFAIEESATRALAAMSHAESLFIASLSAPSDGCASMERSRLDCIDEDRAAICNAWVRLFGHDIGRQNSHRFLSFSNKSGDRG